MFLARFGPCVAGLGGQPHLVVLDVGPGDAGDDRDVGLRDQPAGELAQCVVGHLDAAWCQEGVELGQITTHGGSELGRRGAEEHPLSFGLALGHPGLEGAGGRS